MEVGPFGKLAEKIVDSRKDTPFERLTGGNDAYDISIKLEKALESSGRAVLGSGAECIVVDEGNDRVLAVKHNALLSPIDAKKQFYVHKILTTLFPNNFPKIYASFVKGEDSTSSISGTIRQKIYSENKKPDSTALDKAYEMISMLYLKIFKPDLYREIDEKKQIERSEKITKSIESWDDIRAVFKNIKENIKESGMEIDLDDANMNFIRDKVGNPYYVDTVASYHINRSKKEQLLSFMKSKEFFENDIRTVSAAFDRIIALESEKMGSEVDSAVLGEREYRK